MIDLDRRYGRWPLRVWGLILNLIGNGLAIYGALGLIRDGSRSPHFIIGAGLTVTCILLLAKPSKPDLECGASSPLSTSLEEESNHERG